MKVEEQGQSVAKIIRCEKVYAPSRSRLLRPCIGNLSLDRDGTMKLSRRGKDLWVMGVQDRDCIQVHDTKGLVVSPKSGQPCNLQWKSFESGEEWTTILKRSGILSVRHFYKIGNLIGKGCHGEVYEAMRCKDDTRVAIKSIEKSNDEEIIKRTRRELHIAIQVNHPRIVKSFETFEDDTNHYLVMEYCEGGELIEFMVSHERLSEFQARLVMGQLLSAASFLHEKNIVHRDLKLDNLLLVKGNDLEGGIKLTDFSVSTDALVGELAVTTSSVGTGNYLAPEILRGEPYGAKADSWAVGVIMYLLLSGRFPFHSDNEIEYFKKALKGEANFDEAVWATVSPKAKEMIKKMLCVDANARISIVEANQDPWLTLEQDQGPPCSP